MYKIPRMQVNSFFLVLGFHLVIRADHDPIKADNPRIFPSKCPLLPSLPSSPCRYPTPISKSGFHADPWIPCWSRKGRKIFSEAPVAEVLGCLFPKTLSRKAADTIPTAKFCTPEAIDSLSPHLMPQKQAGSLTAASWSCPQLQVALQPGGDLRLKIHMQLLVGYCPQSSESKCSSSLSTYEALGNIHQCPRNISNLMHGHTYIESF